MHERSTRPFGRTLQLVLSLTLLLAGCGSFEEIRVDDPEVQRLGGEAVRVTTRSGNRHRFLVTKVQRNGLCDGEELFLFTRMSKLERWIGKFPDLSGIVPGLLRGVGKAAQIAAPVARAIDEDDDCCCPD